MIFVPLAVASTPYYYHCARLNVGWSPLVFWSDHHKRRSNAVPRYYYTLDQRSSDANECARVVQRAGWMHVDTPDMRMAFLLFETKTKKKTQFQLILQAIE